MSSPAHARQSLELMDLAFELADEAARSDIECFCNVSNGWIRIKAGDRLCDMNQEDDEARIERALRYLELRGDSLIGFRFIRSTDHPHLVRFEELP